MPRYREIAGVSEGDQTWLGSTRGIRTNRTEILDLASFTVEDDYIPSGTPLALVGGVVVPYDDTATAGTGPEVLTGFLFTDQDINPGQTEDLNVPVMDFGRVRTSRLPVAFTAPTPANDGTTVVFVD